MANLDDFSYRKGNQPLDYGNTGVNGSRQSMQREISLFYNMSESDVSEMSTEELMEYFSNIGGKDIQNEPDSVRDKIDNLPDGVSRYEYGDARYTIYKHGDEYKSEFHGPEGFDFHDFIDAFPDMPPMPSDNGGVIDSDNDVVPNSDEVISDDIVPKDDSGSNASSYTASDLKINGEFDETTIQGNTGDCWVLAGLKTLSSTESGRQIIQDSIEVQEDGSVKVTFGGVGVSYTLSAEEILSHDTDDNTSDAYSNGDNDVLAFELATEYLLDDINSGKVRLNTNNGDITNVGNDIDDGGLPSQIIYFLTGNVSNEKYNDDLSDLSSSEIYSMLQNSDEDTVMTIGIYNNAHSCTLTDGSTYTLDVGDGGHALSVTNIDKTNKTVTIVNPWDSSVEYTMSWDEFVNLGVGYISSTTTSETNIVDEDETTNYDETDGGISNSGSSDFIKPDHYSDKFDPRDIGGFGIFDWLFDGFYSLFNKKTNKINKK